MQTIPVLNPWGKKDTWVKIIKNEAICNRWMQQNPSWRSFINHDVLNKVHTFFATEARNLSFEEIFSRILRELGGLNLEQSF